MRGKAKTGAAQTPTGLISSIFATGDFKQEENIMALIFFGLLILNLIISFVNAKFTGKAWVESRHAGGWASVMAWSGAIMAACGFTWSYLLILALLAGAFGWLGAREIEALVNLGYLIIILPVLGSGITITLNSWANAYRNRTIGNMGVAGYNTFAQAYNTYQAVQTVPDAFGKVISFFFDKDSDNDADSAKTMLVLFLLLLALGGGILTTWIIINREAANDELLPFGGMARRSY